MPATPQPRVENDLSTLRSAVAQASASMMTPQYAKDALRASLRVIEGHERELQALHDQIADLKRTCTKLVLVAGGI